MEGLILLASDNFQPIIVDLADRMNLSKKSYDQRCAKEVNYPSRHALFKSQGPIIKIFVKEKSVLIILIY